MTYPLVQAKNYTRANRTAIDLIVIHTMEAPEKPGKARQVAEWFASDNAPQASAHYCVDEAEVVQSVLDQDVAWHAPGANRNGIGIEHAAYAKFGPDDWHQPGPQAMLWRSAKLVSELCAKYGIPNVKLSVADLKAGLRGICGHKDITDAFNGGKGHWDPGTFVWDEYMAMVDQCVSGQVGG